MAARAEFSLGNLVQNRLRQARQRLDRPRRPVGGGASEPSQGERAFGSSGKADGTGAHGQNAITKVTTAKRDNA